MMKKITVLAMAMGVLAALALPSTASAAWKHGHAQPIQQNVPLEVTGNARFQGALGGIECQVLSQNLFKVNQTTGTALQFTPHPTSDTANCKGLGGLIGCQIHGLTPQTPGWPFHTVVVGGQAKIQITFNQDLTSQATGAFCPSVTQITLTKVTDETKHFVTLIPNQPNTVTTLSLHGQLEVDIKTHAGEHKETVQIAGSLTIKGAAKHTYSI